MSRDWYRDHGWTGRVLRRQRWWSRAAHRPVARVSFDDGRADEVLYAGDSVVVAHHVDMDVFGRTEHRTREFRVVAL